MSNENLGWVCPRCQTVNAPTVVSCNCPVKESKDDSDVQLLTEEGTGGFSPHNS